MACSQAECLALSASGSAVFHAAFQVSMSKQQDFEVLNRWLILQPLLLIGTPECARRADTGSGLTSIPRKNVFEAVGSFACDGLD